MTPMARSSIYSLLACLTLLFFFSSSRLHVVAQNSSILSKRPPVFRLFDSSKNETTTFAPFFNPRGLVGFNPARPSPDIELHSVEYSYQGQVESPPQFMAFLLIPRDKSKTPPSFSLEADGAELHRGVAALREMCCVEINGRSANPQHIVVPVSPEIFERVRQAKKVKLKVTTKSGKYSFKLNDYQKTCLDALAKTLK